MRAALLLSAWLLASAAFAQNPPLPGFYAETQFLWFDSLIAARNKIAPRYVIGYDDTLGARVRYWGYDHGSKYRDSIPGSDPDYRLNFDVVDLEATTHFKFEGFDFLFAGGARIADIDWNINFPPSPSSSYDHGELSGLTFAGEGRTDLFRSDVWGAALVYGGRLSLLTGDYEGFGGLPFTTHNERFTVPEAFAGVEANYGRAFTRLRAEMQDWRGSGVNYPHAYGFTGYGFDLGFSY